MAWFKSRKAPRAPGPERSTQDRSDQIGARYDEMKALARVGNLDGEWAKIIQELFDVEKEAIENQRMPAPAAYKRAAVSLRKQKRYAAEVHLLERFKRVNEQFRDGQALYTVAKELYARLEKARALRDADR